MGRLTAEDVKFSLEKAANKATSGFAADYAALAKVEALDKYTVRLTFKSAIPSVLGILTNYHGGYIVSKKAVEEKGDKFKLDPIGTGPFMLKEYIPKEKVVEVRHPEYFRGKAKLDRVELWFMPDASSREMAFRKGEIDIVEGEREQVWVKKMREIPGTAIEIFGPGETLVIHFNMTKKPLDDIRIRRAICHAINIDELMKFLGPDVTEKLVSPIPMNYLGGTDKVPKYEFNPEKAKKLLAEAGYPKGLDLSMVITEMSDYRRPMEQVQEQLRRVGINLKMDVIAHSAFHEQIRKDVNPLVLYVCARFPTADPMLTQFYYSKSIVGTPTAITNFSHYNKIDDLIEKARVEVRSKETEGTLGRSPEEDSRGCGCPSSLHHQVRLRKKDQCRPGIRDEVNIDLGHHHQRDNRRSQVINIDELHWGISKENGMPQFFLRIEEMLKYAIRRMIFVLPTLWAVVTFVFFLIRIVPGGPAVAALGSYATEESIRELEKQMGLDKPILVQYGDLPQGPLPGRFREILNHQ